MPSRHLHAASSGNVVLIFPSRLVIATPLQSQNQDTLASKRHGLSLGDNALVSDKGLEPSSPFSSLRFPVISQEVMGMAMLS